MRPMSLQRSAPPRIRPRTGARVAWQQPAGRRPVGVREVVMLQRRVGNAAVCTLMRTVVPREQIVVQRTIDQVARRHAMDWLASRGRPFVQAVARLGLPRLSAIIDGVLGPAGVHPAPQVTQVDRATFTTALATALVRLGDRDVGLLGARLTDGRAGRDALLDRLEEQVPAEIPDLMLSTQQSRDNLAALTPRVPDPFLVLRLGGAQFVFSKAMALHMLRRHHPDYLEGAPLQVQSFFRPGTTIPAVIALIQGSLASRASEVTDWRATRRRLKAEQLGGDDINTLNLRPYFDGSFWELTLTLPPGMPQASAGEVAHFTPTL